MIELDTEMRIATFTTIEYIREQITQRLDKLKLNAYRALGRELNDKYQMILDARLGKTVCTKTMEGPRGEFFINIIKGDVLTGGFKHMYHEEIQTLGAELQSQHGVEDNLGLFEFAELPVFNTAMFARKDLAKHLPEQSPNALADFIAGVVDDVKNRLSSFE